MFFVCHLPAVSQAIEKVEPEISVEITGEAA